MKTTTVCLLASVAEGCTGRPKCLALSEGLMNRAINHRSLMSYMSPRWCFCLADKTLLRSPKSKLYFGLGNWIVVNPRWNNGPRWIVDEVEVEEKEKLSCHEPYTLSLWSIVFAVPHGSKDT